MLFVGELSAIYYNGLCMQVGLLTLHSLPFGKGVTDSNSQPLRARAFGTLPRDSLEAKRWHVLAVLSGIECSYT